jgi:hypothetical protein
MGREATGWRPLLAVALLLCVAGVTSASAQARAAYVIEQREGNSVSRLALAPSGLRFDAFAPVRGGGRIRAKGAKPQLGMIIRYGSGSLFLLDPEHRRYDSLRLASAISSYERELKTVARAQPSAKLPVAPGSKTPSGQAPLKAPRARLKPLALRARIGRVRARAYLLREGPVRERLWYSDALPSPPSRVRHLLSRALGGSAAGPLGHALRVHAAQIPLRIDVAKGHRWSAVLRTLRIRRVRLTADAFKPPRGYSKGKLLQPSGGARAHAADVPGAPIRCGILITDPINCTIGLLGPVSGHPAIWAFYWGTKFSQHTDFVSSINHALEDLVGDQFAGPNTKEFWGPLGQYGVGQGRFLGYDIVNDKPDSSIGSWNFFDIESFVFTHRFGSDAPNYWWRFSDEDPIFAIFVDQSEVDSSGWGGYHFFTPTEGVLFSFLVHPAVPWFIVKVPALGSLTHQRDTAAYREAVDTSSKRASHEFVEAATDPYPFLSWADPLKQPIWEEGEVADICAQGSSYPWGKGARVVKEGTALAPYWSNEAQACVPDARPSARITYPSSGGTYGWRAPVTFIVQADDLYDGGVAEGNIRWDSDRDGQGIGHGYIFTTSNLSPGVHHISTTVTDSQYGTRVAGPITVTVVVQPPTVRIDQPANGSMFGSDEVVNYRGFAFDPQQGDIASSAIWSVDGVPVGTGAKLFPYRIPTEGTHTVTLSATNTAGASSSTSIRVNIGPPTGKPTVQITSPESESSFEAGQSITFTAQSEGLGGATVPESGYSWSDDLDGPLGTGKTIKHVLSGSSCVIFTHHVTVTATDTFNRKASDTIAVSVGSIC